MEITAQAKYEQSLKQKGLKRITLIVPISEADRLQKEARKLRLKQQLKDVTSG